MKRLKKDTVTAIAGAILLGAGLFLAKTLPDAQGILLTLPYLCIGLGCGALGQGVGNLISCCALKNSPEIRNQIKINENDERNIAIADRAKAKAFDMMTFVFAALMLSFALMEIDLSAILLLVFSYLFVHGYGILYRCKYEKEM